MTQPRDWLGYRDPAHLFLGLWRYVNAMERERLSSEEKVPPNLRTELSAALAHDDASVSTQAFCNVLTKYWNGATDFRTRRLRASIALAAMRVLDETILAVHPRSILPPLRVKALPAWLDDIRERRTLCGAYAQDDKLSLIARGPFARGAKSSREEASFLLCDQFAAVTVIDLSKFTEDSRPLKVEVKVIDQSADGGVPHRHDRAASEVVSFVPLAEANDDLIPTIVKDGATYFELDPAVRTNGEWN